MSIVRYDPFDALTPLRETVNRLIEEGLVGVSRFEPFGRMFPLDVRDNASEYIMEAAIPGIRLEELQVTATSNTLTVQVTRKPIEKSEKPENREQEVYVRRERYVGEMSRMIELPTPIEADKVIANYEHGILTLHAPKAAKIEPVKVPVQVKEAVAAH